MKAARNCLNCNNVKKIKIFARNPAKGGIPEIEKKIRIKENACILLILDRPLKFDTKKVFKLFNEKPL